MHFCFQFLCSLKPLQARVTFSRKIIYTCWLGTQPLHQPYSHPLSRPSSPLFVVITFSLLIDIAHRPTSIMPIIRHLKLLRIKSTRLLRFTRRVLNRKELNTVQGQVPVARIKISELPDDVLLDIFKECLQLSEDHLSRPMAWHQLVHVCHRWRYIVFTSPLRLDLHLLCQTNTPVKEALDI
ncbi:hypothetical protein BGW80DRAFT_172935 [Lactifluus volemus]|nr:hypothetical protein BGW80DRAFT_172935 [Lactifluus volemus]